MNVTQEQLWEAAFQSVAFFINRAKVPYTNSDVADDVVKRIFGKSYSAVIIENNKVHQTCSLGHRHVIEPYTWRPQAVAVLEILRQFEKPLTTAQIKAKFPVKEQATIAKVPSELVHFKAVKIAGTYSGQRQYAITKKGSAFLDGVGKLPEWAYRHEIPGAPEAPMRSIGEMRTVRTDSLTIPMHA